MTREKNKDVLKDPYKDPLNQGLQQILHQGDFDSFYLIDFGLSYISQVIEDKAVDLYVLKRAIISANPKSEEIVRGLINNIFKNLVRKGN
jgi:tRNA A-37 threonylcarbamoyl transferase component Bud32